MGIHYRRITFLLLMGLALSVAADPNPREVLTIDPAVPSIADYPFIDEDPQQPELSEFVVLNQILMSNEKGERWATVTLKNTASGQRIFNHQQLMAVFANGEKRHAAEAQFKLSGNESATYTFYFGAHRFPILYVYTRN